MTFSFIQRSCDEDMATQSRYRGTRSFSQFRVAGPRLPRQGVALFHGMIVSTRTDSGGIPNVEESQIRICHAWR